MNTIQKLPPGMILHCGASIATRDDLSQVVTPRSTNSWYPLPHDQLLDSVETQLSQSGFLIEAETHSLAKGGDRYFGLLQVTLPSRNHVDFSWIVALRNSHDKSFPAGLVAGTRVFVCDNLAFNGEVKLSRKHTRFASRDLPEMTSRAIGKLAGSLKEMDRRVELYQHHAMTDVVAHDVCVRCIDTGAIPVTNLPGVLSEWREPSHEDFRPRTAWSLFNAVTETAFKGRNPAVNIKRGEALHGVFDSLVLAG